MNRFVLDTFLPYQLAVAAARVSREFSAQYRDRFGISIPEWRVVAHLGRAGSVSVREINERVDMDKSKVSRAAARLEAAGYVTKRANPTDRRLIELALTEKGVRMLAEITPLAQAYEARLMSELGPDAVAFRRGLTALTERKEHE